MCTTCKGAYSMYAIQLVAGKRRMTNTCNRIRMKYFDNELFGKVPSFYGIPLVLATTCISYPYILQNN